MIDSLPIVRPLTAESWEEISRLFATRGLSTLPPPGTLLLVVGISSLQEAVLRSLALQAACRWQSLPSHRALLAGPLDALQDFCALLDHPPCTLPWSESEQAALSGRFRRLCIRRLPPKVLRFAGRSLDLTRRPLVMAILNVTPDSFFDGGRYRQLDAACRRVEAQLAEGADIVDVGGESTRPGAVPLSVDEELDRVIPVVEALASRFDVPLSVDTSRAEVGRAAIAAGASILNDVTGLQRDPTLLEVARSSAAGLILMHMRGTPQTMTQLTDYHSLVGEVLTVLGETVDRCLESGLSREQLVVDPGIGFAKTPTDNLVLIRELAILDRLGVPILVGASRKSFLQRIFGWELEDRLQGSVAAATAAILNGAQLVRVHDVRETRQAVDTAFAIRTAGLGEYPGPRG